MKPMDALEKVAEVLGFELRDNFFVHKVTGEVVMARVNYSNICGGELPLSEKTEKVEFSAMVATIDPIAQYCSVMAAEMFRRATKPEPLEPPVLQVPENESPV